MLVFVFTLKILALPCKIEVRALEFTVKNIFFTPTINVMKDRRRQNYSTTEYRKISLKIKLILHLPLISRRMHLIYFHLADKGCFLFVSIRKQARAAQFSLHPCSCTILTDNVTAKFCCYKTNRKGSQTYNCVLRKW